MAAKFTPKRLDELKAIDEQIKALETKRKEIVEHEYSELPIKVGSRVIVYIKDRVRDGAYPAYLAGYHYDKLNKKIYPYFYEMRKDGSCGYRALRGADIWNVTDFEDATDIKDLRKFLKKVNSKK
jgi:hypothetical protein